MAAFRHADACAPVDPSLPLFIDSSTQETPLCSAAMHELIRHTDYAKSTRGFPYCFPAEDSERIPARAALLDALTTPPFGGVPRQTCAVVGSSGVLQGARLGSQIDAHDLVPSECGTRSWLGLRGGCRATHDDQDADNHRILVPQDAHAQPAAWRLENLLLAITHPSGYERIAVNVLGLNGSTWAKQNATGAPSLKPANLKVGAASLWAPLPSSRVVRTPPWRVAVLNPAVWAHTHALTGSTHHGAGRPTTGALALIFALHFCERVSAFGFSWGSGDPREQAHYYRPGGNLSLPCRGPSRVCGRVSNLVHSPVHEQALRKLAARGSLEWYPHANFSSRRAGAGAAQTSDSHERHNSFARGSGSNGGRVRRQGEAGQT